MITSSGINVRLTKDQQDALDFYLIGKYERDADLQRREAEGDFREYVDSSETEDFDTQ